MLKAPTEFIVVFIIISVILMLVLVVFITLIIYRYQQKQNIYFKDIEALNRSHENALLQSHLEIQEQTFQKISREIHDNIGQKLTLAKLYLNTLNYTDSNRTILQVNDSINIISEAIIDLSDLSHSMSSEIILNNGLIKALEFEVIQLEKSGKYTINFSATGSTIFLDSSTELLLFRIVQEVLNNIVKHANASIIDINLHYITTLLTIQVTDNGKGFFIDENNTGTGLSNIKKRAAMLNGNLVLNARPGMGTTIKIEIPQHENNTQL